MQEEITPIEEKDGEIILDLCADEANADWIRSLRLQKRADKGDKKAAEELQRRFNTPMEDLEEDLGSTLDN